MEEGPEPVVGRVTAATDRGSRLHQEDRWVALPFAQPDHGLSGHLLAVLDGHAGAEAAQVCAEAMGVDFHLRTADDLADSLRRLVAALDCRTRGMAAGTTVSVACVLESHGRVAAAVVGDSPVVVLDRAGRAIVGPEHNVRSNPWERERAEGRGGRYRGGYILNPATGAGLQMARALGDSGMGGILSREPDLFTATLGPDSAVVLASDGLVDPSHASVRTRLEELIGLLRAAPDRDAESLLAWAGTAGLYDNATVVLWRAGAGPTR